jgi:hypothetical protein
MNVLKAAVAECLAKISFMECRISSKIETNNALGEEYNGIYFSG